MVSAKVLRYGLCALFLSGCVGSDSGSNTEVNERAEVEGVWQYATDDICGASIGCSSWLVITEDRQAYQVFHSRGSQKSPELKSYPNFLWPLGGVKISNEKIVFKTTPEEAKVFVENQSVRTIIPALSTEGFKFVSGGNLMPIDDEGKVLNVLIGPSSEDFSLNDLAGVYTATDYSRVISVDSSGNISGSSRIGCNMAGQVSQASKIYYVNISSDSCVMGSDLKGLIILSKNKYNRNVIDFSYVGSGSFSGRYMKN